MRMQMSETKRSTSGRIETQLKTSEQMEVKYGQKKSPEGFHTRKKHWNEQKYRFSRQKAFETTGAVVRKVGGKDSSKKMKQMTDIQYCKRKESDISLQAPCLSNCVQQQGNKCRSLLVQIRLH